MFFHTRHGYEPKAYNVPEYLFYGSQRDIAAMTREFIMEWLWYEVDNDAREFKRTQYNRDLRLQKAEKELELAQKAMIFSSSNAKKYDSIKKKKGMKTSA